jgi:hypothetical protein
VLTGRSRDVAIYAARSCTRRMISTLIPVNIDRSFFEPAVSIGPFPSPVALFMGQAGIVYPQAPHRMASCHRRLAILPSLRCCSAMGPKAFESAVLGIM